MTAILPPPDSDQAFATAGMLCHFVASDPAMTETFRVWIEHHPGDLDAAQVVSYLCAVHDLLSPECEGATFDFRPERRMLAGAAGALLREQIARAIEAAAGLDALNDLSANERDEVELDDEQQYAQQFAGIARSWPGTGTEAVPAVRDTADALVRAPDLRLELILTLAGQLAGHSPAGASALAGHVLALDGELRNGCALPTRWAADDTCYRDRPARPVESVGLPEVIDPGRLARLITEHDADQAADTAIATWVRDNAAALHQALFDAEVYRAEFGLPAEGERQDFDRLAGEIAAFTGLDQDGER